MTEKSVLEVQTRAEWRDWLARNHERQEGVWLITFKKSSGSSHVPYGEQVEEALCFGWVDSKPGKVDEQRTKLWFAPRKSGTGWSRLNKERVERLIDAKRMHEAGLQKVQASKLNGSWSKLDAVEALEVPADLKEALQSQPGAESNFAAFPRSAKRGILEWILQAKRPETRQNRITKTAQLAA